MKTHFIRLRAFLAVAGGAFLSTFSPAPAATLYWDGGVVDILTNGNGSSQGTSGTWNTTLLNWDGGASPHVAWINANIDTAVFAGTAGMVTLGESITAGGLTFNTTGYAITGNTLTLAGTATINTATNVSATINSVIAGSSGLLKSGAGTLIFSSTSNNTFTGGFNISGGVVQYDSATHANAWGDAANVITFTGNATLFNNAGAYTLARGITINGGVTGTMGGAFGESTNVTGIVGGSGALSVNGSSNGWALTLSNSANTFTGAINVINSSGTTSLSVASLGNSANVITLGNGGNGAIFTYTGGAALSRGFAMGSTTGGVNIVANGAGALTASTFAVTGAGAKTLTLDGSSTATNQIAGNIVSNGGNTSVTKTGAGTWALGGTNTYSGVTNLAASGTTGRLVFQGSQSLSPNTSLVFAQNSSAVQSVRFLDDGVGTINFARPISFGGSNTIQSLNIFVGNNNATNLGSSSGTTTGSTVQVGNITFTSIAADTNTTTINATGANGYRLQTGTITLNNLTTRTPGQTTVTALNPTTANMTVAAITMASGNTGIVNDGVPILRLTGTSTDNRVTGEISNATDYLTGQALSLQKQGTSTWTLEGVNTYAGSTAVSAGTLEIGGSGSLGAGNYAGAVSITNAGTILRFNSTADQMLSGVVSGTSTASFVKNNTGKVTLTNTNTFDGVSTINGGILEVSGAGSINSSEVTINGGNFRYNSSVNYSGALTFTSGTISGTNWGGSLNNRTIGANQIVSPGSSPGTASTGGQTWAVGGTYEWEINSTLGNAGLDPGWDLINGSGTLNITAAVGSEFNIDVMSLTLANAAGPVADFNDSTSYNWMIANFNAITGFSVDAFTIDTTAFALYNAFTGAFAVALGDTTGVPGADNTQIWLTYTAIPEPKAALLGVLGALLLLRRRR